MRLFKRICPLIIILLITYPVIAQDYVRNVIVVALDSEHTQLLSQQSRIGIDDYSQFSRSLADAMSRVRGVTMQRLYRSIPPLVKPGRFIPKDLDKYWIVTLSGSKQLVEVITTLQNEPFIERVVPVWSRSATYEPTSSPWYTYGSQWGFSQVNDVDVNAPAAWDITAGNPAQFIGVIDTGIQMDHDEFNATNKIVYQKNVLTEGTSYEDLWDDFNHGTAMAAIIGALNTNNALGAGVLGGNTEIANGSAIVPVKAYDDDDNEYHDEDLAQAMGYLTPFADVINMSLGGPEELPLSQLWINLAYRWDVPIISTTGNEGKKVDWYPGASGTVLTAAGVNPDGTLWYLNNWGDHLDILAPGIIHTASRSPRSTSDGKDFGGTSVTGAFVSGGVGMLLDAADTYGMPVPSSSCVKAIMRASGIEYPTWTSDEGFGLTKFDVALDILVGDNSWGKDALSNSVTWDYDDIRFRIIVVNPNDFGLSPGIYYFRRYHVDIPFTVSNLSSGPVAVWVDPNNTNGTIPTPDNQFDLEECRFAEPLAPFSVNPDETYNGMIRTYTYKVEGTSVWYPSHPSNIYANYTQQGRMKPSANTITEAIYYPPDPFVESVHLEWTRSNTEELVSGYKVYRSDENGPFYLQGSIGNGGTGPVEYDDTRLRSVEFHKYKVTAVNPNGEGLSSNMVYVEIGGGGGPENADATLVQLPNDLTLDQNYPNPFNPDTQIKFGLPTSSSVRLRVMNIRGETVKVLVDEEMGAGWHTVTWDGKNEGGNQVASGIYLYLIESNKKSILMRMTLIR